MRTHEYDKQLDRYNLDVFSILNKLVINSDDLVIICGSVIEGFSNAGSDLDIYVIYRESPKYPEKENVTITYFGDEYHDFIHDMPINVEIIKLERVNQLIDDINSSIKQRRLDFNRIREIELYHRLVTAYPIKGKEAFESIIYSKLDLEGYLKSAAKNRFKLSENRQDDAVGALESEDYYTAYLNARSCLEKAMESLLHIKGQTNPKDKWLIKKLFRVFDKQDQKVKKFLSLYIGNNFSEINEQLLKQETIDMIRFAQELRNETVELI
ncbi:hypothetical protein [Halalkalibacter okhensis]|uniref:Polymerase nucleotidyl transferase domain-containing protein n=1 Tax=Halalkalibacter okhensis TaxID=333138 RepID=A0A0B0ICN3_9BACI|nr:hypothetical protein [Halalkalibacter okhensis]KHF37799.1 hypothetical protein LQ50_25240 [Halalkalibacter okhensis]